jgi:hypothetical protein
VRFLRLIGGKVHVGILRAESVGPPAPAVAAGTLLQCDLQSQREPTIGR